MIKTNKKNRTTVVLLAVSLSIMTIMSITFISCSDEDVTDQSNIKGVLSKSTDGNDKMITIFDVRFGQKSKQRWPHNYCVPRGFACLLFFSDGQPPIVPPTIPSPGPWADSLAINYGYHVYGLSKPIDDSTLLWQINHKYATDGSDSSEVAMIRRSGYMDFSDEVEIQDTILLSSIGVRNPIVIPIGRYPIRIIDSSQFVVQLPFTEVQ